MLLFLEPAHLSLVVDIAVSAPSLLFLFAVAPGRTLFLSLEGDLSVIEPLSILNFPNH